jgi:hypothetical protein
MTLPRTWVIVSVGLALFAAACPPAELNPCFPTSSATPVEESEGGFARQTLGWEIDKMPALVDVPESDAPPSETFLRAQRDMRTEFWADAAHGFLAVVRGDTRDGKKLRLFAQFDFALCLFRLRYFDEAKRVFQLIEDDKNHPRRNAANEWLQRQACSG